MTTPTMFWDSQIISLSVVSDRCFLIVWSFHNIVFVVMICHHPSWLSAQFERLYINDLGKVYEENECRKHFRTAHCDVTAQLKEDQGLRGRDNGRNWERAIVSRYQTVDYTISWNAPSATTDFRLGVSGLRLLLTHLVLLPFSPDETSSPRLYIALLDCGIVVWWTRLDKTGKR